ncbi:hypothetical protein CEP54_011433 [Fusarium duplospermum]|uniref:Maltose/galactoside acetyltransferase domain-containing protein n=1 Tax=Fusarium duplospermum TaxID=1325734 RepID=A0A428PEG7_9HYPO|nr:hypothetical protein CEP54_011433 [Fusarium duplospermum]
MVPPVRTEKNQEAIAFSKTLSHIPWCDDYEKMVSSMLYSCEAPELLEARNHVRRLAQNATAAHVTETRVAMIKEIFGKVGADVYVEPSLQVDYGSNTYLCGTVILDCAHVTIGDRVFFGNGVSLITATHETSLQSRRDNIEYAEPITIGNDCWLGANVTVLPGVTIGKGCTIDAGAVVSKNIPDYSVAVGVPAKVIKKVEPLDD